MGRRLFSAAVSLKARYFGTITPRFVSTYFATSATRSRESAAVAR